MNYIKITELDKMVAKEISSENCIDTRNFSFWNKIKISVFILAFMISSILAIKTKNAYPEIFENAKYIILFILSLFALMLFQIVIHELLHILAAKIIGAQNIMLTVSRNTISIFINEYRTKSETVFFVIFPCISIAVIITIFSIFLSNLYIFLWLVFIDFLLSSSDISSAINILLYVPKNALIYSNYYKLKD